MQFYDRKRVLKFLILAFLPAWALQIGGIFLGELVSPALYTVCTSLCMLTPGLAVWLVFGSLRGSRTFILWKLKSRRVVKGAVAAWLIPLVTMALGAVLYFALFPAQFDPGSTLAQSLTPTLEAMGMPMTVALPVFAAASALGGGFINMFFALGEELGWTGFLVPALTSRVGIRKAVLLRGVVWGVWHWPLILLAGYEYGVGYPGSPWTGLLVMLVFTTAMGTVNTWLYERSGSIWVPAFCHGVLNAIAGLPLMFLSDGTAGYLLGPTIAGPLAGLPLILLAAVLLWRLGVPKTAKLAE